LYYKLIGKFDYIGTSTESPSASIWVHLNVQFPHLSL